MAAQPDLWGDIKADDVRTPVAILREQAALLGPKTKNLIEAKVETALYSGYQFRHSFSLVVPALDDYTYELFSVRHKAEQYPVWVESGKELADEPALIDWLRDQLSSAETRRTIGKLLAQVNS